MSSWWNITFAVTGEFSKLKELETTLSSSFHQVIEAGRTGGVFIAQVAENYGGAPAMEAAIAQHPDLAFNGLMVQEQAQEGDLYRPFLGIDGETRWWEFDLPEDHAPTLDEAREEVASGSTLTPVSRAAPCR